MKITINDDVLNSRRRSILQDGGGNVFPNYVGSATGIDSNGEEGATIHNENEGETSNTDNSNDVCYC